MNFCICVSEVDLSYKNTYYPDYISVKDEIKIESSNNIIVFDNINYTRLRKIYPKIKLHKKNRWDNMYFKLEKYIKDNKKLPNGYDKKYPALVRWIKKNRMLYHKKILKEDHINKLNKIDIWMWNYYDEVWTFNFKKLNKYIQEHNQMPPFRKKNPDLEMRSLILWIGNIRTQYKKGNLSQDQIKLLNNIDVWAWNCKTEKWRLNYIKLNNFVIDNKTFPDKLEQKKLRLSQWIFKNRIKYKENNLSKDQILKLEHITGWNWCYRKSWDELYAQLQTYMKNHNNNIPNKIINKSISNWVNINRNLYKNNKLSQDRIDKLNKLEGWVWSYRNLKWNLNYNIVIDFIELNNRLPNKNDKIPKILTWITNNKSNYKKQKLTQNKMNLIQIIM